MEPTDEMVTAAYTAMVGSFETGYRDIDRMRRIYPDDIKIALRAALAVMPDRSGDGWIAGRDAAADVVLQMREDGNETDLRVAIHRINRMEPPA